MKGRVKKKDHERFSEYTRDDLIAIILNHENKLLTLSDGWFKRGEEVRQLRAALKEISELEDSSAFDYIAREALEKCAEE